MQNKIKIIGQEFEIILIDDDDFLGTNIGKCIPYQNKIWIRNEMPLTVKIETLIHEIIHCISMNLNLELNETQVCGLAGCLYQIINENNILEVFNAK